VCAGSILQKCLEWWLQFQTYTSLQTLHLYLAMLSNQQNKEHKKTMIITNTRYADDNVILWHYFKLCYWLLSKGLVRPLKCSIKRPIRQSMIWPDWVHQKMPLTCANQQCVACIKNWNIWFDPQNSRESSKKCNILLLVREQKNWTLHYIDNHKLSSSKSTIIHHHHHHHYHHHK